MGRVETVMPAHKTLPTPVGGVIYLTEGVYDLDMREVTISHPIQFPEGDDVRLQNAYIIYDGGQTMFVTSEMGGKTKFLSNITVDLQGSGTVFDLTGTVTTGVLLMDKVDILDCTSLGTLDGFLLTFSVARVLEFDTGLTLNNMALTDMNRIEMVGNDAGTTYLDFTGTEQGPAVISNFYPTISGNDLVFDFNSTVTYNGIVCNGSIITLSGSATSSDIFASGSYNQKTVGFYFSSCVNIPDSTVSARIGFQGNATETTIDQTDVPVRVNGTYTDGFEERTSYTSTGIITYNGLEDVTLSVRAYVSLEPSLGVTILMGGYIAKTEVDTYEVTFTNGTNLVNRTSHGLSNGTSIRFSTGGTLPVEIRDDQFYWVVNAATNTFQVSNTLGGAAHTFTDDGTGTHYYSLGEYIDNSEVTTSPSINEPDHMVVEALITASTGDKYEVFVDNHDSTSNVLVTSLNFILNKI